MKTVNFNHKRATTFDAVQIQIKTNNVAENLTGATILMQLRKEEKGKVIYTFMTTITDAVNGWFEIDEQLIDVPSCIYKYDIQIEFANGTYAGQTQTWISGLFAIDSIISETT